MSLYPALSDLVGFSYLMYSSPAKNLNKSSLYEAMSEYAVLSDMVAAREFEIEYPNEGSLAT
jgi:hypothetical protein